MSERARSKNTSSVVTPSSRQPRPHQPAAMSALKQEIAALRLENARLCRAGERFELAAESADQGVWELDVATDELYVAPKIIALLGYRPAEVVDRRQVWFDHSDPQHFIALQDALRELIANPDNKLELEMRVSRLDGSACWWLVRALALCDEAGSVLRLVGSVSDITRRHMAEAALQKTADRYRAMFESLPLPMYVIDTKTLQFIDVNQASLDQYGYTREEFLSMRNSDIRPKEDVERMKETVKSLIGKRTAKAGVWRHLRKDGSLVYVDITSTELEAYEDRSDCLIMAKDVTEQFTAQEALAESESRFRSLFENAVEGIYQTTPEGRYLRVNPALARMYGYESPEQMTSELTDLTGQLYVKAGRRSHFVEMVIEQGQVENFISQIYRRDGSTIWISENARCVRSAEGAVLYFEGTVENITERITLEAERERMLQDALERADRDPLTGLLNHRAFHKRLEIEADRAQRNGSVLAVAVLDLDNFKFFNDAYGHVAGDAVLRTVAENLSACCRSYDVLARFGGDEFAVLIPDTSPEAAHRFVARVRKTMEETGFQPEGYDIKIPLGVSVGVALFPHEAPCRQEVIELADNRLRRAKSGGDQDGATDQIRSSYSHSMSGFSILDALVTAVDSKDRYTRKHSEDVMIYCLQIARELNLDEKTLDNVQLSALLHDVGKIGVPDAILRKPGNLNAEERAAVQQHAQMGAMIVSAVPGFSATLDGVRYHHERWDGQGYPEGLVGEETPLIARIMAVADAYSAMTTNRPYRSGLPAEQAMAILAAGSGVQWDPKCVAAFMRARAVMPVLPKHESSVFTLERRRLERKGAQHKSE